MLYVRGMSDSNAHTPQNLPLVLLGAGVKGGRHLKYAGTPLTNLHTSLLASLDIPVERFGDSTGRLEELSGL